MAEDSIYLCYAAAVEPDATVAERVHNALEKLDKPVVSAPEPDQETLENASHIVIIVSQPALDQYPFVQMVKRAQQSVEKQKKKRKIIVLAVDRQQHDDADIKVRPSPDQIAPVDWPEVTGEEAAKDARNALKFLNTIQAISLSPYLPQFDPGTKDNVDLKAPLALSPPDTKLEFVIRQLREVIERTSGVMDAFFSYSRRQKRIANAMVDGLQEGHLIWFDRENIAQATNWLEEIERGVAGSRVVICQITTEWLDSPNCWEEFEFAEKYHKPIVRLQLEAAAMDELSAYIKAEEKGKKRWEDRFDRKQISAYVERLREHPVIHAASADFIQLEETATDQHLKQATRAYSKLLSEEHLSNSTDYQTRHAELLLKAFDGERYNPLEIFTVFGWIASNEQRTPPVLDEQRDTMWRSAFWFTTVGAAIILPLAALVILALVSSVNAADARAAEAEAREEAIAADLRAQETIIEEAERRLQTIAQAGELNVVAENKAGTQPLAGTPRRPVLLDGSLWTVIEEGGVQRIPLSGSPDPAIMLNNDSDLSLPVSDGQRIWLSDNGSSTLYGIDIADGTVQTYEVGNQPDTPTIAGDTVWVHAQNSGQLAQINPATGDVTSFPVGLRATGLTATTDAVWFIDDRGEMVVHIDAMTGTRTDFAMPEDINVLRNIDGTIWALARTALHQMDATDGIISTIQMDGIIADVAVDHDTLWVLTRGPDALVRVNAQTHQPDGVLAIPAPPDSFTLTPGRAWIIAETQVLGVDTTALNIINTLPVSDDTRFNRPVSDGLHLWLTTLDTGSITLIDMQDASIYREFDVCESATGPVFDGMNMWFACPDTAQVTSLPAVTTFLGEASATDEEWRHAPIAANGVMWMAQENTGRVIAHDLRTNTRIGVVDTIGEEILPLAYDDRTGELWTAGRDTGRPVRIDTTDFLRNPNEYIPATISTTMLDRDTNRFHLADEAVWLIHDDLTEGAMMTVVDRDTLLVIARLTEENADIASGLTLYNGDAWATIGGTDEGNFVRYNAATGMALERLDFPDTESGAWAPHVIDDQLWFSIVLPDLFRIIFNVANEMTEEGLPDDILNELVLRGYNPATGAWSDPIPLPSLTARPHWDGQYLWYLLSTVPSHVENAIIGGSLVFAADPAAGEIIGRWQTCENSFNLHTAAGFAWQNCELPETTFAVIDPAIPGEYAHMHIVGTGARAPLELENSVWFSFFDSDVVAAFDPQTGDLLRAFSTGDGPTTPVYHDGGIWVYHSRDDTLRRIDLHTIGLSEE